MGKRRKAELDRNATAIGRPIEKDIRDKYASALTEVYFVRERRHRDRPVLVFHHIQKTAGTALRMLIRKNLPATERAVGKVRDLAGQPRDELLRYYREYYAGLSAKQRSSLCCVMAHSANYILPALDRPAQAITVVRDPVERVLSQYYMRGPNAGKPVEAAGVELAETYKRRHDATLGDIYRQLSGAKPSDSPLAYSYSRFFNGQSRSLLEPHYDTSELPYGEGPSADADVWRERLFQLVSERYLVGLQERFDEFVDELVQRFGWRKQTRLAKVGPDRPRLGDLSADVATTFRAHNWLDDELHRFCAELVERRRAATAA